MGNQCAKDWNSFQTKYRKTSGNLSTNSDYCLKHLL